MAWIGTIVNAFSAIKEIFGVIQNVISFIDENKDEKWFQESAAVFSKLQAAKTSEERREVAKNIRDLLSDI